MLLDTIIPDKNGRVIINSGKFGWEWNKFNDAYTKASYALTALLYVDLPLIEEATQNLHDVIKEQTLSEEVVLNLPSEDWDSRNYGYIDHQSVERGQMNAVLLDKSKLHNFIFNKKSWLFLGNDNEEAPNKFYDTEDKVYNWKLVFTNYPSITQWEFEEFPDRDKLIEAIEGLCLRFTRKGNQYIPEERPYYYSSDEEYYEFPYNEDKRKVTDTTIEFVEDIWSRDIEPRKLVVNYTIEKIK
ncbi:hypothetical protein H6G33_09510 [Calothrix sp. FACHB-1219]|uniref:hypothetical protein n=1 Tax=unclassified Calothrix TaxID=2619626 RepID=UPI001683243F|nr:MULTISPECIES: hypothetical protein [unclassified Calothrix]MBD2201583.1 hypothetical protein [Calothrix sp. FACHB-168]MBD2217269.1 hypothetical protein [Calothrix sp. FACHB-1219]